MTLTIPAIPNMPAGHVATSSDMNQLANAASFLLHKPIVHVHDGTGGYAFVAPMLCWDTMDFDTDGMWSSSNKDRLTVQTPGWYKFHAALSTSATGGVEFFMRSTTGSNNPLGSGVTSSSNWEAATVATSSNPFTSISVSGIWPFYLYQGDFLTVRAAPITGTANTIITGITPSFFSMEWVSS